eukprot:1183273-Prorocentrum_minimum.AAC.1
MPSFYGSSCANNGEGALNTLEMFAVRIVYVYCEPYSCKPKRCQHAIRPTQRMESKETKEHNRRTASTLAHADMKRLAAYPSIGKSRGSLEGSRGV